MTSGSGTSAGSAVAYTSTVVGYRPALLAAAMATGIAAGCLALVGRPETWLRIGSLVVIAAVSVVVTVRLATVRLAVSRLGLGVGSGLSGHTRWIPLDAVGAEQSVMLTWPQVYGIGLRPARRMTRLTVRAGPALRVDLRDGEQLWISTPGAPAAAALLARWRTATPHTEPGIPASDRSKERS
jgi:hypothetical protein